MRYGLGGDLHAVRGARFQPAHAVDGDNPFAIDVAQVRSLRKDDLSVSGPIPQHDEADTAKVPDTMDPALEEDLLTGPSGQLPTQCSNLHVAPSCGLSPRFGNTNSLHPWRDERLFTSRGATLIVSARPEGGAETALYATYGGFPA